MGGMQLRVNTVIALAQKIENCELPAYIAVVTIACVVGAGAWKSASFAGATTRADIEGTGGDEAT